MIEKTWPDKFPLQWPLLPFFWLHGLASGATRPCCKLELKRAWRIPVPVVVVGNLTTDGNGKTPAVIWLVEQLQQRGIYAGVVPRGHDDKAESCPLLPSADTTTAQAGDESVLTYQRTDAPAAVSPVRFNVVKATLAQHSDVRIIVTDDGLQHCRLTRDMEIVVTDDVRCFGNDWWLSTGPMCERVGCLESVDAITVDGGAPRGDEIPTHLPPGQAMSLRTSTRCDVVQLEHVVAIAGTGHPPRSFVTLKICGVQPEKCVPLVDHQSLNHIDVGALVSVEQTLIMIEKDTVEYRASAEESR